MLVLTTMFINVSNNLPKTSYVKMIDIWLIFNLLLPFIEVLVHTYMDTLRWRVVLKQNTLNRNDEDREINHHGRPVDVGEAESRPGSTAKVFCRCDMLLDFLLLSNMMHGMYTYRLLTKTLLLWMNKFSWRRWKASTKGKEIVISDIGFIESFDFRADNMRDKRKRSLERCQRYCVCWDWNCCIICNVI